MANTAPTTSADNNTVTEDTAPNPISGNVLTNDSDPDGDILAVANWGTITLQYGSLEIHADGSYTYTLDNSNPAVDALNTGQHLTDTFTYTASDGNGGTTSSTLTITINGSTDNRPPVVDADTNTIREDATPNTVSGNVLSNDSDPDGHTLSVANAGTITLQYGSLAIHADGSYTYTLDNSNPAVDALNTGQHLTDTFTYVASDGHGGTTSSTLTVTIDGSTDNRPPVVSADTNTIREDATPNTVSGNVLSNDSDADGNTLSVANAGTITLQYGSLEIHADGSYTYTLDNSNPAVDALNTGQHLTDTFTYVASDGHGGTTSSTLTVRIDGTTDNRPPVVIGDTNTILEDATPNTVSGNVLANDNDPDGHTLSVANAGTITLQYGSLEIHADGSYTYTLDNSNPAVDALNTGQHLTDTFTYTASDGHGGTTSETLTITINGSTDNRPPVVDADTNVIFAAAASNTVSGNVLSNDSDPDGHTLSVANAGTITLQYGSLEIHADGSYTYTLDNSNPAVDALNTGQHLTDTFTYTASDGHGGTTSSTLTVTINAPNTAPAASADANTVSEDASPNTVTGNVLTNDSDADGHTISVSNAGVITLQYGSLEIHADGSYTYTLDNSDPDVNALNTGQSLTDTFTYTVSDGYGGTDSEVLTITINGTSDNQAPVARADTNTVTEGSATNPVTGNLLANDSDVDGDTLTVSNAGTVALQYGSLTILADGSYSYTLDNANASVAALAEGETLTDSFTYAVSDGNGGTSSASLSITINGTDGNLAPVNTLPSEQTILRNNALVFSAASGNQIAISDPDAGTDNVKVTLTSSEGLMTLSKTTGLTFTQGDGTSDTVLTVTGTIADINAALEGMKYLSAKAGTATISMTTDDLGHGGSGDALTDTDVMSITVESNVMRGTKGVDDLKGTSDGDDIRGLAGNDRLLGMGGDDALDGGNGKDHLDGGAGADTLTGGLGGDVFWYRKVADSTLASMDVITDFAPSEGDRIDLSAIDANAARQGNQAFTFIGKADFSGKAGELRYERSGAETHIYGDTDGDGVADLAILLDTGVNLRAGHFEL